MTIPGRSHQRRQMLRIAAGTAALSFSIGKGVRAQTKRITFITPIQLLIGFAPAMNAQLGGHFRRHGLDVNVVGGASAPMAVQQTIVKRADVMRGAGTDIATAVAKQGAPLIAIGTIFQASSFVVVSQKSKPVHDAKDFKGMVVGVPGRQSGAELALDMMLIGAGIAPRDVQRESVGNGLGSWGLIKEGRLDAAILSVSAVVQIRDAGEDPVALPTETVLPAPGQVYAMHRDRLAAEPELPVQFLRGIRDSLAELRTGDQLALVKRMAGAYPIVGRDNPGFLVKAMMEEIKLWLAAGEENVLRNVPERWSVMVDAINRTGIAKIPDAAALYTNAYVDKI
jgi:ABC-type nitrate/sulfonate/bicarbonate transport system substrate-binding protein